MLPDAGGLWEALGTDPRSFAVPVSFSCGTALQIREIGLSEAFWKAISLVACSEEAAYRLPWKRQAQTWFASDSLLEVRVHADTIRCTAQPAVLNCDASHQEPAGGDSSGSFACNR